MLKYKMLNEWKRELQQLFLVAGKGLLLKGMLGKLFCIFNFFFKSFLGEFWWDDVTPGINSMYKKERVRGRHAGNGNRWALRADVRTEVSNQKTEALKFMWIFQVQSKLCFFSNTQTRHWL